MGERGWNGCDIQIRAEVLFHKKKGGLKSSIHGGKWEYTTNNVISNMHEKGYTIMEIADVLKMSSEEVIERWEKR